MVRRLPLLAALAAVATGCAGTDDDRFRAPAHATWGDWESKPRSADESDEPEIVARTVFQGPDGPYQAWHDDAGRTVVPQAPLSPGEKAPRSRPQPVGPRTVTLRRAPLDSALRHLADAGRFNLLIEGDLTTPVSAELRGVEPYEALVALAGANGAFVRYDGQIVVVTAHAGTAP